ncbi:MAG: hypothetical protein K9L22_03540 [Methylococcaceae bacterium]|nr:hypothetical protein [Methylococcaceae bacterium]
MITKKPINALALSAALIISVSTQSHAQEAYVYPAQGQSPEQQEKDQYSCYVWAKNKSGVDPMNSGSNSGRKSLLGGAARGAAGGAIIGAIAGDAGKGAAIGAATGGVVRGLRNSSNRNNNNSNNNDYDRAYAVCLEGRGYNVK